MLHCRFWWSIFQIRVQFEFLSLHHVRNVAIPKPHFQERKGYFINGQSTLRGIFVLENSVSQRGQREDASHTPYMIPAKAMKFLMLLVHQMRWRIMAAEQSGGVVFMPLHSGMKHEITQNR
jgi:hypothetical protein